MTGVLPAWVREGGPGATAGRLADPSVRERLNSRPATGTGGS